MVGQESVAEAVFFLVSVGTIFEGYRDSNNATNLQPLLSCVKGNRSSCSSTHSQD